MQDVPGFDASLYQTERVWTPARDGQRVPVTLAWRKDRAQQNGKAPLLVTGYGAYGNSYDATFSLVRPSLMDRGFVLAIAHVRGGADLGQAWYEAGRLMNKKNTFNDFIDATEALVKAGWGAADKVFASGGSAGGLLMGVVANEAPQLYRGIVMDVPFVDVISTMLDETRALKIDRNPLLLAVNMTAGHGGASGRFSVLAEHAREYAFLLDLAGQTK